MAQPEGQDKLTRALTCLSFVHRDIDRERWHIAVKHVLQWAKDTKVALKKRKDSKDKPAVKKATKPKVRGNGME